MNKENVALLTKEMRNTDITRCENRLALEKDGEIVEACVGGLAILVSSVSKFQKIKTLRVINSKKDDVYNVLGAFVRDDGRVLGSVVPEEVWDWFGGNTLDAPHNIYWEDDEGQSFPLRDRLDSLNDTCDLTWDQFADLIDHFGLVREDYQVDYYQ